MRAQQGFWLSGALASVLALSGAAHATDYFGMNLTGAVFAATPLGPPEQFKALPVATPSAGARPVATIDEPAARTRLARASTRLARASGRVRHRNPLDALAYAPPPPRARPCAAGRVCVWDGKLNRWRSP